MEKIRTDPATPKSWLMADFGEIIVPAFAFSNNRGNGDEMGFACGNTLIVWIIPI